MIHFTTHNSEPQICIGVPDDAIKFKISGTGWLCYRTTKFGQWYILSSRYELFTSHEILGTFDKEKNEIDFEPKKESMFPISKYSVKQKLHQESRNDMFWIVINGANKHFDTKDQAYEFAAKNEYLDLLQSVTKKSKENKFVIIQKLTK